MAVEFVSEPILPETRTSDASAMAAGLPGLPRGFTWRGAAFEVLNVHSAWKHSAREKGNSKGEMYLRRHYYRLQMSDGSQWVVYFVRQAASGRSHGPRWFLYERQFGKV